MEQLTVRHVPPAIVGALRAEAKARHTSVSALIGEALAEHVARTERRRHLASLLPAAAALREEILAGRAMESMTDSVSLLRDDRDR